MSEERLEAKLDRTSKAGAALWIALAMIAAALLLVVLLWLVSDDDEGVGADESPTELVEPD